MPGTALRATKCELYDRIEIIADMIATRATDRAVREQCKEMWGLKFRQISRLMARARQILIQRTQRPREEHQVESYNLYLSELQRSSDPAVRLKAQERIDSILGLDAKYTGGPYAPPASNTTVNVTINVAGLSSDQIEELVERGEALDPKSIEHLPRADRLRILRKAAQVMGPKE